MTDALRSVRLSSVLNRNNAFALVVLAACVLLAVVPSGFQSAYAQNVNRVRSRVLSVDDSRIQQYGIVRAGSQLLTVEILDGPFRGQVVEACNDLIGKMETDKMFREGDTALVVLDTRGGTIAHATAYDHYRLQTEWILIAAFGVLLVAFAGWTGARALLSFAFALLMMWKVLFPNTLLGRDPVLLALASVIAIAAVTLALVAGVNRTALVAFIGSLLGVVLTSVLALVLLPGFKLHGAVQPYSETLLYTGFEFLNLNRLFVAAIFIGASGAVVDVAIDVATAMQEVADKRPDLSHRELALSGFTVGRNMTSTMITTLLMAYVSGYMSLLMVFMAQGTPPSLLLNTNYVAAEILKTVVGSFGLVAVAPFTALVGSVLFIRSKRREDEATATIDEDAARVLKIKAGPCDLRSGDVVQRPRRSSPSTGRQANSSKLGYTEW